VRSHGYASILDCGCGLGTDAEGYAADGVTIVYKGLDNCVDLIAIAAKQGLTVVQGSVEAIPEPDASFDVVHARHLLEHLPSFETALGEMVRVARFEAIVVFFLPPSAEQPQLNFDSAAHLYQNCYHRPAVDRFARTLPRVISCFWEPIDNEIILHITVSEAA
jgi:ubiquinone/menaquinone biosynthesis C-methylase UbiE